LALARPTRALRETARDDLDFEFLAMADVEAAAYDLVSERPRRVRGPLPRRP